ncbi:MAG: D-alanyl-D-alanine carboxypeptidase family protein [Actinomycetota bacterium]
MPPRRPGGFRFTWFARFLVAVVAVAAVALGGRALLTRGADGEPSHTPRGQSPVSSTTSSTTDATRKVPGLPACDYGTLPAPDVGYGRWQRTLLDTAFALPQTYQPPDLVSVTEAGFASPEEVRSLVIPDLAALRRAAEANGTPVDVLVAYRSYARQAALFQERIRQVGHAEAIAKTARPGHSEHQLGTTIDFRTKGQLDVTEDWESTPTGAWMADNGWRYGFLMSYPSGRADVTCYQYEPWHYRYFGRAMAGRIHASGLTPREYLWRLDSARSPSPAGSASP